VTERASPTARLIPSLLLNSSLVVPADGFFIFRSNRRSPISGEKNMFARPIALEIASPKPYVTRVAAPQASPSRIAQVAELFSWTGKNHVSGILFLGSTIFFFVGACPHFCVWTVVLVLVREWVQRPRNTQYNMMRLRQPTVGIELIVEGPSQKLCHLQPTMHLQPIISSRTMHSESHLRNTWNESI
jgi:hypothetical protein